MPTSRPVTVMSGLADRVALDQLIGPRRGDQDPRRRGRGGSGDRAQAGYGRQYERGDRGEARQ